MAVKPIRSTADVPGLTSALAAKVDEGPSDAYGVPSLSMLRNPVLAVESIWPRGTTDYRIVWAQGATAYAVDRSLRIRKSTDGGRTWALVSAYNTPSREMGYKGAFLKLANGNLIAISNEAPCRIFRSTDDGANWTAVYTFRNNNVVPLTSQSWCQDEATGYIYAGEYTTDSSQTEIRVIRSTDNGATWETFKTFNGPGTAAADRIKHVHACQYDPVSQRVYITAGDGTLPGAGIYRVNAGGTDVEPVLIDDDKYPVAMMFFPTHIAWGADSGADVNMYRMARTEIGQPSPAVEAVFRMSSTSWGTCRCSTDGSEWLCMTSNETPSAQTPIDKSVHVYHVTANGATVREVGCIPATNDAFAHLMPVGSANVHDATLWLASRGFDGGNSEFFLRCNLAKGTAPLITNRPLPPRVLAWQTVSVPRTTVAASGTVNIATLYVPNYVRTLYIFDAAVHKYAGSGSARVALVRMDNSTTITSVSVASVGGNGLRIANERLDGAEFVTSVTLTGTTLVEVRLLEYGGASSVEASGYVTFGWGV